MGFLSLQQGTCGDDHTVAITPHTITRWFELHMPRAIAASASLEYVPVSTQAPAAAECQNLRTVSAEIANSDCLYPGASSFTRTGDAAFGAGTPIVDRGADTISEATVLTGCGICSTAACGGTGCIIPLLGSIWGAAKTGRGAPPEGFAIQLACKAP